MPAATIPATVPSRRLKLPGGGYFELPMPTNGARVYVHGAAAPSAGSSDVLPIVLGAALGGAITWLVLRVSR